MIKNYDQSVKINNNPNRPYIPDPLYRILIIGVSGTGKTNGFLNLIRNQIMTKFTYMLKIHLHQSVNCLLMQKKK